MGVQVVLVLLGVEVAMHPAHEQVQHGLLQVPHREVLVEPVMADEDAAALLVANVRRAVAVHARNHPQLVRRVVVVPHVVAKGRLLVRPVLVPVAALLVALARRALVPHVEELLRAVALLRDDEARVPHDPAVVVAVAPGVGILGHGDECLGRDVPHAHQPLEGHVRVHEDGVGVEEDDKVVRLEGLLDHRDLDPGAMAAFVGGCADEAVVVSVDHGCAELVSRPKSQAQAWKRPETAGESIP